MSISRMNTAEHTPTSRTTLRLPTVSEIGARDGWRCFYCNVRLTRKGEEGSYYIPSDLRWDHCGCGLHDLRVEPCEHGDRWNAEPGYYWAERDHVIPRCQGGTDHPDNIVLSCGPCNSSKGKSTLVQWANRIERAA